jgi:hypothetical protein
MHALTTRMSVPYSSLLNEFMEEERRATARLQDPFFFSSPFDAFHSHLDAMFADFDQSFSTMASALRPSSRPSSQLTALVRDLLARDPMNGDARDHDHTAAAAADDDDDDDAKESAAFPSPKHSETNSNSDSSISITFSSVGLTGPKRKTPSPPRDDDEWVNVEEHEEKQQPPLKATKM